MKLFVLLFFLPYSPPASARLVERVQAQVAEEMISLIDIKNFQKRLKKELVPPSLLLTQLFKKSELLKDKNKLLDFMIYRSLLSQIAEKNQLPEIPEEQAEAVLKKLKKNSSEKRFSNKLTQAGLKAPDLKQEILIDLRNDLLLNQSVASKIVISDQDIESHHLKAYKSPLFKSFEYEFASVSFSEQNKEALFNKLAGAKVKDLKKTALSLGLDYKVLKLKQKDLQTDFQKELDKLSVSQLSPVLFSGGSYYLLQLKWKYPQVGPQEQKRKAEIERFLYNKQLKEEIKKWLEEQKKLFAIRKHPV